MTPSLASVPDRASVVLGHRTGTRIRLVGKPSSSSSPAGPGERRRAERMTPEETNWSEGGRLRSGQDVRVLDISASGVQFQAPTRLQIGNRIEVCLTASDSDARLVLLGVVRRCEVASLGPMTYAAAMEFETAIDIAVLQPFVESVARSA